MNRLLDEGLLEDLEIHTCEVFNRATHLTQCFRCEAYGNVTRACKNTAKCAFCVGDHSSVECRRTDDPSKATCANCHRAGHAAWMKACPIRDREIERVQTVRMNTPARFRKGHEGNQRKPTAQSPACQRPSPAPPQPATHPAPVPLPPHPRSPFGSPRCTSRTPNSY